jgi:thioredoxin-related protein
MPDSPNQTERRIEVLANIGIIIVAVLLASVLIKKFVLADTANPAAHVNLGNKITLPDVDWTKKTKHLVLVLQKGCHFCSESAPFYQKLVRDTAGPNDVQLIAALPQEMEEGQQYLEELGVSINEVRQAAPASLGVRGTPTLLLVDNSGRVTEAWVGKLSSNGEDDVIKHLNTK